MEPEVDGRGEQPDHRTCLALSSVRPQPMLERACGLHCKLRPLQGRRQTIGAHCWRMGRCDQRWLRRASGGSGSPLLILLPNSSAARSFGQAARANFGLIAAPVSLAGARNEPVGRPSRRTQRSRCPEAIVRQLVGRRSILDLSRFGAGFLRAILAIEETGYGNKTQRRVQAGCGSPRRHRVSKPPRPRTRASVRGTR
jgi:hypothetical protein